jgi:septal ring factor EnvC (AmiA/AmiB activator)
MPDFAAFGWLGYVGMAITIAIVYFPKAWKESKSDDKEIDRVTAALSDERIAHKDTKAELKEANARIFQQVADFAKMNADNATLVERMDHMVREQQRLSAQNESMNLTIKAQNEQIKQLTTQVDHMQDLIQQGQYNANQ